MPTVAVIPVRSFGFGKQRLASTLSDSERKALGVALAERVGSTAEDADLLPLFVTAESEVAAWAMASGFPSLPDGGTGLDGAAAAGTGWAMASGSSWLVVHADLPLLGSDDLQALRMVLEAGGEVIAPSADGGTSAIGAARPFEFFYGPGSFHRHLPRLLNPTVVATTGLLHDVDSHRDLQSALSHSRGSWVDAVLT